MTDSKKTRILLITARADYGGGPEHIYRLLENLNNKAEFFIACPKDHPYWKRYTGIIGENKLFEIPHRRFSAAALSGLYNFSRKNKIEIIHSHGKGAGIYGRALSFISSLPCVHTFHGIHTGEYSWFVKTFYILLEKALSYFTKKFIAVSAGEYERAVRSGIAPERKTLIIENGVKLPENTVSTAAANKEMKRAVTITRFDYSKNTGLLINIAGILKSEGNPAGIKFTLIGSGPDEEKLKDAASAKGLNDIIEFTGFTDRPGDYLVESFCYISTSRWEGMPLGVLEAMSYGLPVIATNVSGNKDAVVQGENGFLYDPANPSEAADHLKKLAGDKELWKRMSLSSRRIAEEKYDVFISAKKTYNVYLEILNKRRTAD